MKRACLAAYVVLATTAPLLAVQPDEVMKDPVLERQAREISSGLRCLVCQNQSIDESDAPLARDLRLLVRDRLRAGDNERQVLDFVVQRYGEFVLLKPVFGFHTLVLWLTPVFVLGLGALGLLGVLRRRAASAAGSLDDAERMALDRLLGDDGGEQRGPRRSSGPEPERVPR
jgi:cytochrome c-type biogenesis protein CcmH